MKEGYPQCLSQLGSLHIPHSLWCHLLPFPFLIDLTLDPLWAWTYERNSYSGPSDRLFLWQVKIPETVSWLLHLLTLPFFLFIISTTVIAIYSLLLLLMTIHTLHSTMDFCYDVFVYCILFWVPFKHLFILCLGSCRDGSAIEGQAHNQNYLCWEMFTENRGQLEGVYLSFYHVG